jgi:predicted RNase H-like HicB family nuclease
MRKFQYLVRIDKDPDSDWGASVPDLPGCVATGKTVDAALRRIERAISLHLDGCAPTAAGRPNRDAAPSHRANRQAA